MKMCLSLFKGTVGLVTLKNKLLEKSLNLANNPVEYTLVLVFLLQIHATGPQVRITEPHGVTPFGLLIHKQAFTRFTLN